MKSTYQSTAHTVNQIVGWICLIAEFFIFLACCLHYLNNSCTINGDETTWAWCLYPIYGFIGWLPVGALWEFVAKITDNTSK